MKITIIGTGNVGGALTKGLIKSGHTVIFGVRNADEDFKGKDITVSGKVVRYKGKPAIIVSDPKQLKVILIDNTKGVPAKQF